MIANEFFKKIIRKILSIIILEEKIDFQEFVLRVNNKDKGGLLYRDKNYWAELSCPIYQEIVETFKPTFFLDIGANYGFTSLVHFVKNPECKIIAVEPSSILIPYLQKNLKENSCCNFDIVNSVCTDQEQKQREQIFSLNPNSSQDNRVIGLKGWKSTKVSCTTIDSLLVNVTDNDRIFIKIDTQGFEEKVFKGGEKFFKSNINWIVKSEFAPHWLTSQGSDPQNVLEYLINLYMVFELPKRSRFKDSIDTVIRYPINKLDIPEFVDYIQKLANGYGWCDILVLPRDLYHKFYKS
ncbi:MAG: FkbM family methyltransferase [Microcystis sp. M090S1]|nr:FkbM family methyltransferase [Microcystis sp. M090S1]